MPRHTLTRTEKQMSYLITIKAADFEQMQEICERVVWRAHWCESAGRAPATAGRSRTA